MIQDSLRKIQRFGLQRKWKGQSNSLSPEKNVESALRWFQASLLSSGGSSAKYSLLQRRFYEAYPETTGYWINSLYQVKDRLPDLYQRVFSDKDPISDIVTWLLSIQRRDGSFPGSYGKFRTQPPTVFNNGQILLGLIEHYERNPSDGLKEAIQKCVDFLVLVQDEDGAWRDYSHYQWSSNTRTAWALAQWGKLTDDPKALEAAEKNIGFALSLLNTQGYFTYNGFDTAEWGYTHTIAYAIRGVLECGLLLQKNEWVEAARKAYDVIAPLIQPDGFLPGQITWKLKGDDSYACLTGNCQMAIIAFKLEGVFPGKGYKEQALSLLNYVRMRQLQAEQKEINGGIAGSYPINGKYNPYEIPNWSAKFFVEAILTGFAHLNPAAS